MCHRFHLKDSKRKLLREVRGNFTDFLKQRSVIAWFWHDALIWLLQYVVLQGRFVIVGGQRQLMAVYDCLTRQNKAVGNIYTYLAKAPGSGKALWGIDPDRLKGNIPLSLPDVHDVRQDIADYLGECCAFDAGLGLFDFCPLVLTRLFC